MTRRLRLRGAGEDQLDARSAAHPAGRLPRAPQRAPDHRPPRHDHAIGRPTRSTLVDQRRRRHARRRRRPRRTWRVGPPSRFATARAFSAACASNSRSACRWRRDWAAAAAMPPRCCAASTCCGTRDSRSANLIEIAGEIGSDPPFFIVGGTAMATRTRRRMCSHCPMPSRRTSCWPRRRRTSEATRRRDVPGAVAGRLRRGLRHASACGRSSKRGA